jgi:hypothetical protein
VKRYYTIQLYKSFAKTNFYTIQEEGKEYSETDDFFLRFKDKKKYKKDIETIKYWIEKIGKEYGAQERHFRPERKAKAIPIPPPKSKLRLYCYHINEKIVILGNGGVKSSQKVQDSPDAYPHFTIMNIFATILLRKIRNGEIAYTNRTLTGKLSFYIK